MKLTSDQMLRIITALARDIEYMEREEAEEHKDGIADEFWSDRIYAAQEAHRIVSEEFRNAY